MVSSEPHFHFTSQITKSKWVIEVEEVKWLAHDQNWKPLEQILKRLGLKPAVIVVFYNELLPLRNSRLTRGEIQEWLQSLFVRVNWLNEFSQRS